MGLTLDIAEEDDLDRNIDIDMGIGIDIDRQRYRSIDRSIEIEHLVE